MKTTIKVIEKRLFEILVGIFVLGSTELNDGLRNVCLYVGYVYLSVCSAAEIITRLISTEFTTNII